MTHCPSSSTRTISAWWKPIGAAGSTTSTASFSLGTATTGGLDHPDRIVRVSSGYSPRRHLGLQLFRRLCAGRQPSRFGSDWREPHRRAHSTHILKPQLQSLPGGIYNEFYSHEIARHMGLSQFSSEVIPLGQTTFLAIERFDRRVSGRNGTLVHQEDVTQALGLDWRDVMVATTGFSRSHWKQ
ncbi:hypothetical protein E3O45_17120 [Cryobacterium sp. TMS1-20-1]|nr:hypothetical protein E3O45_17120 [Cryobacterium sp. TMS1-20-1]